MSLSLVCRAFLFFLLLLYGVGGRADYAGSERCIGCHASIYAMYMKSGHPHKLIKVAGTSPVYPANTSPGIPAPPTDYSWKDISYVIGGFGWKARFLDQQGYILTGEKKQYNLPNAAHVLDAHWVAYGSNDTSQKPYTCGECHTTGWVASGSDGPHQDGLPGIYGTWEETGVRCEACHGPSAAHVLAPTSVKPSIKENCQSCHIRGDINTIDASNGLIRHHEQYEDLLASPHQALSCSTCHNPHQSTKYDAGGYKGDTNTCQTCHQHVKIKIKSKETMACKSCHMPYAVKSALSTMVSYQGGRVLKGDLRTHIYRISTDASWNMFTDDGKFVRVDKDNKAYLTLDHVCMSCHSENDVEWARTHAERIH